MNLKSNIYTLAKESLFLDPVYNTYQVLSPEKKEEILSILWNKVKNLFTETSNALNSISDITPILERIQPEIMMRIYHAVMILQENYIPISSLFKNQIWKSSDCVGDNDKDKTSSSKLYANSKASFTNLSKNYYQKNMDYAFPDLLNFIYNSIFYNGKDDASVMIKALFPDIILMFRLNPSLIPGHSDATLSQNYIKNLEKQILNLRSNICEDRLLLYDYEIDMSIGLNRLYSTLNFVKDMITPLLNKKPIEHQLALYGDCFKLLYELPFSLHEFYGARLVDAILAIENCSAVSNSDLFKENPEDLESVVKEMILINGILLPEISAFMAQNIGQQITVNSSYGNFTDEYIINYFKEILVPEKLNNSYVISKNNPFKPDSDLTSSNTLLTPTFIKNNAKNILSSILPTEDTFSRKHTLIKWKQNYRSYISMDAYIDMVYEQVITVKQFVNLNIHPLNFSTSGRKTNAIAKPPK